MWQYDKRSVNGANFVYFGMELKDPRNNPEVRALIEYSKQIVKALGIVQGPSHMEVMSRTVTGPDGVTYDPCLVEVGARCHGGEATWLPVAMECIGYSMLDATLNAFLRPDRFDALPTEPCLTKSGCEAFLVSYETGTLKDIPGLDTIRQLSSFRRMEMMTQPGAHFVPTIDCFSRPGSVQLVNATEEGLKKDYESIRSLEMDGLFELM